MAFALEIVRDGELLILDIDGCKAQFYILKPHLSDAMIESLQRSTEEAQVYVMLSGLVAMGALS